MASRGKQDEQGFLSRWSQRKRAAEEAAAQPEAAPVAGAPDEEAGVTSEAESIDLSELPDIDSLEAGSDFTVFMRAGVPRALKQRALRRLWQVDPAFHHICMLDDYNLDYTDAATVVPNLKTIYQVGRGMVLADEEEAAPETAEAAPEEPGEVAPSGTQVPAEEAGNDPLPASADEVQPRKPQPPPGPKVAAAANPPAEDRRSTARSARQRRWGDPDNS